MIPNTKRHAALWAVARSDGPVDADDVITSLLDLPDGVRIPDGRAAVHAHLSHLNKDELIGRTGRGEYVALADGQSFIDKHGAPEPVPHEQNGAQRVGPETDAYRVLHAVAEVGVGTNGDIFEALGSTGPAEQKSVAAVTTQLWRRGLLEKRPSPTDDGFQFQYRVTEDGQDLVDEYGHPDDELVDDLDEVSEDLADAKPWVSEWPGEGEERDASETITAPTEWDPVSMGPKAPLDELLFSGRTGKSTDPDSPIAFTSVDGNGEFSPFIDALRDVENHPEYELVEGDIRVRGKSVYVTVQAQRSGE